MHFSRQNIPPSLQTTLEVHGLSVETLCESLLQIADQVADLLLAYYRQPQRLDTQHKADRSPVTAADHAAHALILDGLAAITPAIPVLSEESAAADIAQRLSWPTLWVVDPLDGTREFIDHTDEFTCNIALVVEGSAVLGLISVPARAWHYVGVVGAGAMRCRTGAGLTGEVVTTRRRAADLPLVVLASARHSPTQVQKVMDQLAPLAPAVARLDAGSAVKFCDLLDGRGDVYPRTSPCYEWDVAAGDALVTAAGGRVHTYAGESLRYNARPQLLAEPFIAAADPAIDYVAFLSS